MSDLFFTSPGAVSAAAAVDALLAYRNDDGGLGQALEPDLRAPTSHPLAVDFGLETAQRITEADAGTDHNVRRRLRGLADDCATWLSTVLTDEAGLPIVLPDAAAYARAAHWGDCRFDAGLNPTAGIVVRLRRFGVDAPWLAAAERFCVDRIEAMPADEMGGHTLANILAFLASAPDRSWAMRQRDRLTADWDAVKSFHLYPGDGYGLTPLDLAPAPDDRLRARFPQKAVGDHLTVLAADQQSDGGWGITWEAPGEEATQEWRAVRTVEAMRVLRLNGHPDYVDRPSSAVV